MIDIERTALLVACIDLFFTVVALVIAIYAYLKFPRDVRIAISGVDYHSDQVLAIKQELQRKDISKTQRDKLIKDLKRLKGLIK